MTWSPVSSSDDSEEYETENAAFSDMVQSSKPIPVNFFRSHVSLGVVSNKLSGIQLKELSNFKVKTTNEEDNLLKPEDPSSSNSDNESFIDSTSTRSIDIENLVKYTEFASLKCKIARTKLLEICRACHETPPKSKSGRKRKPIFFGKNKYEEYIPCENMNDLYNRLEQQKINPMMAVNEMKQLNPEIKLYYRDGNDQEREIAKARHQMYDKFSTIQFCNTILYCKKMIFEYKNQMIEFLPAVDRHEKTAKNRAASNFLDQILELKVRFMENKISNLGFEGKGWAKPQLPEIQNPNDKLDSSSKSEYSSSYSGSSSYKSSSDYCLDETGFKRLTKSGEKIRDFIQLDRNIEFNRFLDQQMLLKIRNFMSLLKIGLEDKFACIIQYDGNLIKIVAFAGPSEKDDFRSIEENNNNKNIHDSSTICLLRRSFQRYLHDLVEDCLDKGNRSSILKYNSTLHNYSIDSKVSFHLYYNQLPSGAIKDIVTNKKITCEDIENYFREDDRNYDLEAHLSFANLGTKMTESDKISVWQLLGWQGGALSILVGQVCMKSFSIGSDIWENNAGTLFDAEDSNDNIMLPFKERVVYVLKMVLDRCRLENRDDDGENFNLLSNKVVVYKIKKCDCGPIGRNSTDKKLTGFINTKTIKNNISMSLLNYEMKKYYNIYEGQEQIESQLCSRRLYRLTIKSAERIMNSNNNFLKSMKGVDLRDEEYWKFKKYYCTDYKRIKDHIKDRLNKKYPGYNSKTEGHFKDVNKVSFKY